ncbi:MAG: molecular chaperone DnaK, partial [Deltaproteobacteria bacterium]|nr:molecular chaperone DnaK [Deltaproteobacteria bacterium]
IEATPPAAEAPEGTPPTFKRVAVGDHLLLGGDNIDLALARRAEQKLQETGARLSPVQWGALVQACRAAKEVLLANDAPERVSVTAPGAGSRLIGGTLATELTREEVRAIALDGFFPQVAVTDAPVARSRTAGLAELGLPYAQDAAITRHAASFLRKHARTVNSDAPAAPIDAVLFNGGALASPLVADRLLSVLSSFRADGKRLKLLDNDAPDLAVARGAATYALVRRGLGLRIGGGSPRTYFLGVGEGDQAKLLCVVPRGAPEGVELAVPDRTFSLVLGKPVRFRIFSASGYRPERTGDLTDPASAEAELDELPPLQAVVPGEGKAQVSLHAILTEIGTLELWCVSAERRWKLEFQLRGESARESSGVSELPKAIEPAREALQVVFGKKPNDSASVKDLWRALEKILGDRSGWSLACARDLWGVLWANAARRRRSADHERIFFALCGFALRPGFGAPLDAWRVEQTWTLFSQGLTNHKEAPVWAAWWILWRRIAAGLPEAAHVALFEAIAPHLKPVPQGRVANPGKKPPGLAVDEMVRLLGALERLPPAMKTEAAGWLIDKLASNTAGVAWALGRLGARVPVAGAAHAVVPPEVASAILERLLALQFKKSDDAAFAVAQLARLSGDRTRDLEEPLRQRAIERLHQIGAPPEWSKAIREVVAMSETDEQRVFGEALPLGLHLA